MPVKLEGSFSIYRVLQEKDYRNMKILCFPFRKKKKPIYGKKKLVQIIPAITEVSKEKRRLILKTLGLY